MTRVRPDPVSVRPDVGPTRPPGRVLLPIGLLVALLAASCSTRGTPEERFADALATLFADSFGFEITVEADRPSLNELGEGAQAAAEFLQGLSIRGVVEDRRSVSLELSAFGVDDVVQLLMLGSDALYLRASVTEFSVATGTTPLDPARVAAGLTAAEVDSAVVGAVGDFLGGEWIAVSGLEDVDELAGGVTGNTDLDLDLAEQGLRDAFGPDLEGFVDRFLTLTETPDEDVTRYEVALDVAALVQASNALNASLGLGSELSPDAVGDAVSGIPDEVPGTVIVHDGVVSELIFDVAEAARSEGADVTGTILVRIALDDAPPALAPPGGVEPITVSQVSAAVRAFVGWRAEQALRELEEQLSEFQGQSNAPGDGT